MTDDLKAIKASEWRETAAIHSRNADWWKERGLLVTHFSEHAAADYCAKMAEEAEGREACARGEHIWKPCIGEHRLDYCFRSGCLMTRPHDTDEPSAEDVRAALIAGEQQAASGIDPEWSPRYRVVNALIRDAQKRGVLP